MKDYFQTRSKFLQLDIAVPYKEMLEEAQALKERFTAHREGDGHKGWKSLTLFGLGESLHENWSNYGYSSAAEAAKDFKWTEASELCPITKRFLLEDFPCQKYGRVRFMLLEAGGYIGWHNDSRIYLTENINIPLSNPKECIWHWGDGDAPLLMTPGVPYAMNIAYHHSITNFSNEDRYHIIIARHDSTDRWKSLIQSAAEKQGVVGEFIQINDLP